MKDGMRRMNSGCEIPFPPRSADDIETYDQSELLAGFMEFKVDDPFPGENRSPAYRWGWQRGFKDHGGKDEFDHLRRAVIERAKEL